MSPRPSRTAALLAGPVALSAIAGAAWVAPKAVAAPRAPGAAPAAAAAPLPILPNAAYGTTPGVAVGPAGSALLAYETASGSVLLTARPSAAAGWSAPASPGGHVIGGVSAAADPAGHPYLAAEGSDGATYVYSGAGGAWTGWLRLAESTTARPGVVVTPAGVVVAVRGTDGALDVSTVVAGQPGAWHRIGGYLAPGTGPALAVDPATGDILAAVVGTGGQLWLGSLTGAAALLGWRPLAGSAASDPAVLALGGGLAEVVAANAAGAPSVTAGPTGTAASAWSGWQPLGGTLSGGAAAAAPAGGPLLVVLGRDGSFYAHPLGVAAGWTRTSLPAVGYPVVTSAPAYTASHYASDLTGVPATDYRIETGHGCARGRAGNPGLVVLDFGAQTAGGTLKVFAPGLVLGYADIEAAAEGWLAGFRSCAPPTGDGLVLALGTNNSGNPAEEGTGGGQAWAAVVDAVAGWNQAQGNPARGITVAGADDIEPGFGAPATARAWVAGYAGATALPYYDYGSADGCPGLGTGDGACSNGWAVHDLWYVAAGTPDSRAVPEIYTPPGPWLTQQSQWANVAYYAALSAHGSVLLAGEMTQSLACGAPGNCPGTDNIPPVAWQALWSALHASPWTAAPTLPYSTDITRD